MRKRLSAKKYYERLPIQNKLKLQEIELIAKELMIEHGVLDYQFEFGRSRKYAGICYYGSKFIRLDIDYCIRNDFDKIKNTILHEIAHALVGEVHGHRKVWQDKAKELGVTWTRNYRP